MVRCEKLKGEWDDEIKRAGLESLVPEELEKHLTLNSTRLETFEFLCSEVMKFVEEKFGHTGSPKLVQLLRASQSRRRPTSQTTMQGTRVPGHHGPLLFSCRTHRARSCSPSWTCSRHDGGSQRGGKGAGYMRLGGGRTLASMETEEGDLPHRWRTVDPDAKKLSSSVDPSVPHHQSVRLRT